MKTQSIISYLKKFRKNFHGESGLTLIEVVVASAVSTIMMLMVYAAHSSVTNAIYKLTGVADFYENVNLAISRIDRDISCAYFKKKNKKLNIIGDSGYDFPYNGKINFVTVDYKEFAMLSDPKMPYPRSDIKEVGYYLEPDKEIPDLFFLMRREEIHYDDNPEEGGESNIILENVIDLRFEYRMRNDWTSSWNSRENNRFPKVIRTTIKIRNYSEEEEEFIFLTKINLKK